MIRATGVVAWLALGGILLAGVMPAGALAPPSQVDRDISRMQFGAVVSSVREKIARGEISEHRFMHYIQEGVGNLVQRDGDSIRLDVALPAHVVIHPDGNVTVDVTAWIDDEPVRVISSGEGLREGPAQLPPLAERVLARGGRLLDQEIPAGPYKTLLKIIREQGWHEMMVFGGTIRNLLLERQYIAGDLDVVLRIELTDEEKRIGRQRAKSPGQLRQERQEGIQAKLRAYFRVGDLNEIVIDGAPLHMIGTLDEDGILYAGFARGFSQPTGHVPNVSINALGILPDTLQVYNPAGGLEDLTTKRLRFSGRDLEGPRGINYHEVFRILRLESQLAHLGMRMDPDTARIVESAFRDPETASTQILLGWAREAASLKKAYPDLEETIRSIRRLREKKDSSQKTSDGIAKAFRRIAWVLVDSRHGQRSEITDAMLEVEVRDPRVRDRINRMVDNYLVEIDLEKGTVQHDRSTGIGAYVLQMYQGADDPARVTRTLHRIGADVLLKALGIDLGPLEAYAHRVLVEDRLKEMKFGEPARVGQTVEEYRMGRRVVKILLRPLRDEAHLAFLDEVLPRIQAAIHSLGGLIPPTTLLRDYRIKKSRIENVGDFVGRVQSHERDEEIEVALIVVQDAPGRLLKDVAMEMAGLKDWNGLLTLMQNLVDLHTRMWQRGMVHLDARLDGYLIGEDGKTLLYTLSGVHSIRRDVDYSSQLHDLRHMWLEYFDRLGDGVPQDLRRRFESITSRVLRDPALKSVFETKSTREAARQVFWPHNVADIEEPIKSPVGLSL